MNIETTVVLLILLEYVLLILDDYLDREVE